MEKDPRLRKQIAILDETSLQALAGVHALKDILCETQALKDKYADRFEYHRERIKRLNMEEISKCPPDFTF